MKALLLSIKPEYVEKILKGEKKYEYRKRLAQKDIDRIYIYCTAPLMKVVASVSITERLSDSPTALWEKTKQFAGISRSAYRTYFHGCKLAHAYKLGKVDVFKEEQGLASFGVKTAPQSFAYIDI